MQAVIANQPDTAPDVAVVDYDTDGYEPDELRPITQSDGSQSLALVIEHFVEPAGINLDEVFQNRIVNCPIPTQRPALRGAESPAPSITYRSSCTASMPTRRTYGVSQLLAGLRPVPTLYSCPLSPHALLATATRLSSLLTRVPRAGFPPQAAPVGPQWAEVPTLRRIAPAD